MHLSEILNHLGEERENYFQAVAPPVIQSSNFAFETLDDFRQAFADEYASHCYTRGNNPTVEILCKKLAALEKSEAAIVFGSGCAAIAAAILSNVKAGDHIVCVDAPYSWTKRLLRQFLPRFGVTHTFVNGKSIDAIREAIRPETTLLFLESPTSLTFELQDLAACAELAREHGMLTCIDNSYCSPIFQNPIEFGIDIVVHSGTKYLNGHSDVVVGVLCASQEIVERIYHSHLLMLGGILSPHDANLVIRGLRTLELRMHRSHDSAMKIANFLQRHQQVERVMFPFLKSSHQYNLAKKQMRGCGGLFSIRLKIECIEQAELFFERLERFLLAVSWGGHESLVLPFAGFHKMPGGVSSPIPWKLVRFYIGLEDPDWLIADLQQAFDATISL